MTKALQKVSSLPNKPGCYIYKNSDGRVLYVGKAKELKKRVSSYFRDNLTVKTQHLMSKVDDFDFMITETEAEALILENNLIKKFSPKYNIRLRDDKSYPYIGVDLNNKFPKLLFLRRPKRKKGLKLFGPYPVGFGVGHIIRILNKLYQLRDCSDFELRSRKTPCLLYQIDQCSAPCVEKISQPDYMKDVELAMRFLEGKKSAYAVLEDLEDKMQQAAESENFEKAAIIRDGLFDLRKFLEGETQQQVENIGSNDIDVVAYHEGEHEIDLSFYMVRNSLLIGQKSFHFLKDDFVDSVEVELTALIYEHYQQENQTVPTNLIVDLPKPEQELLKDSLQVRLISPQNRNYQKLVASVKEHAKQTQVLRQESQTGELVALSQLTSMLELKERARVLECFDVAIWQGKSPTASLIHFEEGKPDKAKYRYYHLKELPEGNNDFAMMQELFERRIKKENFPDVFIVDGGKGQVSVVKKILDENSIDIPVIGIAKSRVLSDVKKFHKEIDRSEERLIIPGRKDAVNLKKTPELYRLLTSMRDEAHRFSRKLHHKAERKRIFHSWVDEVKGINDSEREALLSKFPKPKEIQREDLESLEFKAAKITAIMKYIEGSE